MAAKSTKKQARQMSAASNVERLTVNGQEIWHVRSVKTGRIMSLTTSPSTKRSLAKGATLYGSALQRLANR